MSADHIVKMAKEDNLPLPIFVQKVKELGTVFVVEPGMIVTSEYTTDNTRFFPNVNDEGTVTGGSFG